MSKRIVLVATVLIFLGIGFNSCKKYEEGPSFTLLTATKRITGTWELKETQINGQVIDINEILSMFGGMVVDSTSGYDLSGVTVKGLKMKFEKDGTGSFVVLISMGPISYDHVETITWVFDDKKDNINITFMGDNMSFEILRLTNKELWLSSADIIGGTSGSLILKAEKEE